MSAAGDGRDIVLDGKKKRSVVADEIVTVTGVSSWKGSEIWRLKKEALAADDMWKHYRHVPGGMELWLKSKEDASKVENVLPKKKKKILKRRMNSDFIHTIRTRTHRTVSVLSDEKLATKSEPLRQMYIMRRYIDDKWIVYVNALIQQYDILGYAEDEDEITEDEDEEHD